MFDFIFKGSGRKEEDCNRANEINHGMSRSQHAELLFSVCKIFSRSKLVREKEIEEFLSVEDNIGILTALTIMFLTEIERAKIVSVLPSAKQGPESKGFRPQTFGEKAVGIGFNPAKDPRVQQIKESYAKTIDYLENERKLVSLEHAITGDQADSKKERLRQLSIAITEAQTSQMWAVKSLTWR